MKLYLFTFYLLLISTMLFGQKPEGKKPVDAKCIIEVVVPPRHIETDFKSINEWLTAICDSNNPKQLVDEFIISLTLSSVDGYRLTLQGTTNYRNKTRGIDSKIVFEPVNMFYKLPDADYKDLDYKRAGNKVYLQLQQALNIQKISKFFLIHGKARFIRFDEKQILLPEK
jgi:hypothetical protein